MGRLPRHDDLPGASCGPPPTSQPEEKQLRDRRRRAVLHRLPLRRLRRLGLAAPRTSTAAKRVLLGLREHVDRQGPVLRRRRLGRLHATSSPRARTPRAASRPRPPSGTSSRTTAAPKVDPAAIERLKAEILKPLDTLRGEQERRRTDPTSTRTTSSPRCSCSGCRRSWTSTPAASPRSSPPPRPLLKRALELLGLPQGGLGEARRRNLHELMRVLGEHAPHVPGRGARPHHPVPRGDALARLLLPRRQARSIDEQNWQCFVQLQDESRRPSEWEMIKRPGHRPVSPKRRKQRSPRSELCISFEAAAARSAAAVWEPSPCPSREPLHDDATDHACPHCGAPLAAFELPGTGWDAIPLRLLQRRVPVLRARLGVDEGPLRREEPRTATASIRAPGTHRRSASGPDPP